QLSARRHTTKVQWCGRAVPPYDGVGNSRHDRHPRRGPEHERKDAAMPELTPFGMFHAAIGLIAVVYGVIALARDKQISPKNHLGQFYLVATLVTAVSAL